MGERDKLRSGGEKPRSGRGISREAGVIEPFFFQITHLEGHGKISGPNEVSVIGPNGEVTDTINAKNIMIATGSEVTPFPGIEVRGNVLI